MALVKKTTRSFVYKRADGYPNTPFDELVRSAQAQLPIIGDRKMDVSIAGDGETFHVLNDYHNNQPHYFAGVLCSYSPGRHQQIFPIIDTATTVPLSSLKPTTITQNGKSITQEFLDGSLYFILRGNHVVLSPSMAFRPEKAEYYFNWLLRYSAKLLRDQEAVYLQDQPPLSKITKIDHVRNITIDDAIIFSASNKLRTSETHLINFEPKGYLWEALKGLIPGIPESVSLTKALSNRSVRATLTLKIGRKGKDAQDFFDQIATATRNQDDLDFVIDMGKHGKLKSNEFKLKHSSRFDLVDGTVNQLEVFHKMSTWLDGLIATKRVVKRA